MTSQPLRLWAPLASRVRLAALGQQRELTPTGDGWFVDTAAPLPAGTDYGYLLDDSELLLPDPTGAWLPEGVHGPSRIYDEGAHRWSDARWSGRPIAGAVIYELHIGTFTPEGTLDAAAGRLKHLADLGITHVELLPVNAYNGRWGWGYDGVAWYAVHEPYGGPDALKRFVDAAHARGLAVVLDVVYNHLGPSGNMLPRFGPYLKQGRNTWGDLLNLDAQPVRRYILENALRWLRDFHVDALRLDAVHALQDCTPTHLLAELAKEVDALASTSGRELTLIAESDLNDPVMITARDAGGYGLDAQWDDDVHHQLHALLTGERQGYYADFGTLPGLAKVMTSAFFHDGTFSEFRRRPHGKPVDRWAVPGHRFVVCIQNHDQVGNRAVGDRITELLSPARLKIAAVLLLSTPFVPMLWMGEEWGARTRWPFFTSHPEPELAKATGEGRLAEFADHGWDVSQMIDPQDPTAFTKAVLDWSESEREGHRELLALYRELLRLRRTLPGLADPRLDLVTVQCDEQANTVMIGRIDQVVLVNLGTQPHDFTIKAQRVEFATGPVHLEPELARLPPESAAILTRAATHPIAPMTVR